MKQLHSALGGWDDWGGGAPSAAPGGPPCRRRRSLTAPATRWWQSPPRARPRSAGRCGTRGPAGRASRRRARCGCSTRRSRRRCTCPAPAGWAGGAAWGEWRGWAGRQVERKAGKAPAPNHSQESRPPTDPPARTRAHAPTCASSVCPLCGFLSSSVLPFHRSSHSCAGGRLVRWGGGAEGAGMVAGRCRQRAASGRAAGAGRRGGAPPPRALSARSLPLPLRACPRAHVLAPRLEERHDVPLPHPAGGLLVVQALELAGGQGSGQGGSGRAAL